MFMVNFKEWVKEKYDNEDIFSQKEKTQKTDVSKLLGFDKPLKMFSHGTFATLYQHPKDKSKLIKITAHKDDVLNTVMAQKLGSPNVVKVFNWPDKQAIKKLPTLNSLAIIVEKIIGTSISYENNDFYNLSMGGNFELASDWLNSGGDKKQQLILNKYSKNTNMEQDKLSSLFAALFQIEKLYKIDLADFQDNILDAGDRYIIVDLGF
jgi:hypothetical protein